MLNAERRVKMSLKYVWVFMSVCVREWVILSICDVEIYKKQSFFLAFPSYSLKDCTLLHSGECRRAQQGNGVRYILQMKEQIGLIVNFNMSTHFMLKHYLLRHWNFLLLVTECNVWLKLETAVSFLCDVIVASCCLSPLSFQGH